MPAEILNELVEESPIDIEDEDSIEELIKGFPSKDCPNRPIRWKARLLQ